MSDGMAADDYRQALAQGREAGAAHATDPQLMAMFCENTLQILAGAVSPQLVWAGAQARGMTTTQLLKACNDRDYQTLDALQFRDPPAESGREGHAP
jgi:hypothetical protein